MSEGSRKDKRGMEESGGNRGRGWNQHAMRVERLLGLRVG